MRLTEALALNLPIKRRTWLQWLDRKQETEPEFTIKDVLAEDWEVQNQVIEGWINFHESHFRPNAAADSRGYLLKHMYATKAEADRAAAQGESKGAGKLLFQQHIKHDLRTTALCIVTSTEAYR